MKNRRIEWIVMFATLLVANFVTVLWLQSQPFASAWASGVSAPDAPEAPAAIPTSFSYQGVLRGPTGALLTGQYKITLKIYNVVTGGSALYSEIFNGVTVRDGLFSVVVGDQVGNPINAAIFNNATLYLGIAVNNDAELLPRQRLHPVPWAMQASTAQTAVTANNLVQGGGVPNLVTLGTGGASEIAFPANSGKISDGADGMTLTGGGSQKVTTAGALTVGGDLTVNGDWKIKAIHEIGDSNGGAKTRADYDVNLRRYVVEAPDNGASPDTVALDEAILTQLCQDEDGCTVNLYMRDWEPGLPTGRLAGVGPYRLSLSPVANNQRYWDMRDVVAGFTGGIDGNSAVTHGINIYNACFFTDGAYVNAQGNDSALGFGLLNWAGAFDSVNMVCVLIIED